jgi:hypothetical protein
MNWQHGAFIVTFTYSLTCLCLGKPFSFLKRMFEDSRFHAFPSGSERTMHRQIFNSWQVYRYASIFCRFRCQFVWEGVGYFHKVSRGLIPNVQCGPSVV